MVLGAETKTCGPRHTPLAAPSAAPLLAKFQWGFFYMLARAKLSSADRLEEEKEKKIENGQGKGFYHFFGLSQM